MILVLLTVLDTVAGVFTNPFVARSDAEAQRIFALMAQTDEAVMRSPSDYKLFRIGTFNMQTGEIVSEIPQQLRAGAPSVPAPQVNGKPKGRLARMLGR